MEGKETSLSNPLAFIDGLFQGALEQNEGKLQGDEYGEHEAYEALLQSSEFVEKIPYLNKASLGRIPHNALVRYRGLVQDVYNEEYFTGVYEQKTVKKGGGELISSKLVLSKYRDIIDEAQSVAANGADVIVSDFESPNCKIMQRQSLLCVPIPGESEWVSTYCGNDELVANMGAPSSSSSTSNKKKRASESEDKHNEASPPKALTSSSSSDNIGSTNDENCMPPPVSENVAAGGAESKRSPGAAKKVAFSVVPSESGANDKNNDNERPRPIDHPSFYASESDARGSLCCLAKVYDHHDGDSCFRLNDMVEVVGVYSLDNAHEDVTASSSSGMDVDTGPMLLEEEAEAKQWPASIAPRVHVLCYRRVGGSFPLVNTHTHLSTEGGVPKAEAAALEAKVGGACTALPVTIGSPGAGAFCPRTSARPDGSADATLLDADSVAASRKAVLRSLTTALDGDALAAEYCLLTSLSRVIGRHDDAVLGTLPLVLSLPAHVDQATASRRQDALLSALRGFMPRAMRLQADLSSLNASQFSPVKDYERNLILPSPLQLGEGTALIVDETRMAEGTLSPQGVQSVRALSEVVQRQTLPARFAYCEVAVRTDLPCVIFATASSDGGCRSVFDGGHAVRIPLRSSASDGSGSGRGPEGEVGMDTEEGEGGLNGDGVQATARDSLYWASVRLVDATMGEALVRKAESDFVAARTASSSSSSLEAGSEARMVDQSDFSRWLTIARLLAVSEGSAEIQERHWLAMRALEAAREGRLRRP